MMEPPVEVRAAAETAGLGSLRRTRRLVRMFFYYQTIATMVLFIIAGIVFVGWLLNGGPAPLWLQTVMVVMVLGGAGFAVWVVVVGLARARTVGEVDLFEYEGGFVRASRSEIAVFPWAEVDLVERFIVIGGGQDRYRRRVHILRQRGDAGRITQPLEVDRDIDRVTDLIMTAALPAAVDAALSPTGARFGALTVGPSGVTARDGMTLSWPQVERVVRERDEIRVYRAGLPAPWAEESIGEVPNVPVLLAAVEQVRDQLRAKE